MSRTLEVRENNTPIYNIIMEHSYSKLHNVLDNLNLGNKKVCIISDTNVSTLYLESVTALVSNHAALTDSFIFPAGEDNKNLVTVNQVYEYLIQKGFDRNDLLVALGGGVVGDLTGFVAATYLRGIDFIQLPTTLLAMVDSSIGGKTGVDFLSYKNMIGAFHQPKAVYINTSVLNTLNENQYSSGFGEVIKYGLISDKTYYQWIKTHHKELLDKDTDCLEEMIYQSCFNKKIIVEQDPKEQGIRAFLNFGHTIGHSIEKYMNFQLLHGDCVALGSVCSAYLSYKRNYIDKEQLLDIIDTLNLFHLPTKLSSLDSNEIIQGTKKDKKMEGGKIKFILLKTIGQAVIEKDIFDEDIKEAIDFLVVNKEGLLSK